MGDGFEGFDGQKSIDVSDEGLAARGWEPESMAGDEPVEAVEETIEEDPVEQEEPADEVEEEVEGEPAGDGGHVPDVDESIPDELRGKTPAELAKMVLDSQSELGRRSGEIGELRKSVEQMQQQQQLYAQQMLSIQHEDVADDLLESAEASPAKAVQAYNEAMTLLDNNAIDIGTVEQIVEKTYEVDPRLARMMERDFDRRMTRAEIMGTIHERFQQDVQPVQEFTRQQAIQLASAELYNADADTAAYQQEIIQTFADPELGKTDPMIANLQHLYSQARTAPQIKQLMQAALELHRGRNPIKSTRYSQSMEQRKVDEQVETGSGLTPEPATEEEAYRQSVFKAKQPADQLFANFGAGG